MSDYSKMYNTFNGNETAPSEEPKIETLEVIEDEAIYVLVTAPALNLRKTPNGEVISVLKAGDRLETGDSKEVDGVEWLYVHTAAGLAGYAMSEFLAFED